MSRALSPSGNTRPAPDLAHPGPGHVPEHIAVPVHDVALPLRLGVDLGSALHQTRAGVRDHQLDAATHGIKRRRCLSHDELRRSGKESG